MTVQEVVRARRTPSYVFVPILLFSLPALGGYSASGAKIYSTFTLTDSAWALTTSPEAQAWSRRRILTIQACFQIAWAGSVTIGALGGSFIPESVVGLDFALTAFFLALCIDMCRNRKNVPVPLVALGCAVFGSLFFSGGMLVAAMLLFVTFLLARYAALKVVTRRA